MFSKILTGAIALSCVTTTLAEVSITVYNQNRAVVTDSRTVTVDKGVSELKFPGISAQVIPQTVGFESTNINLLEQNFEYDLVDGNRLMEKYLDETVVLTLDSEVGDRTITGKLLSGRGNIVVEVEDGRVMTIDNDFVISATFPELPDGLITRPTLKWLVNSTRKGTTPVTLTYLTGGMSWSADYVALLNEDDTEMSFACWVTVANHTGTAYENANLKLIAGEPNIVAPDMRTRGGRNQVYEAMAVSSMDMGKREFTEKSFFEYHMYSLSVPATLKDNQDKQLALFPNRDLRVTKEYVYNPRKDNDNVLVSARFENSKDNNMGIPLPKGVIRVYKLDEDKTRQFLGEDRIDHTPKDEPVNVSLGKVFDMTAKRSVVSHQPIGKRGRRETVEFEVNNRKDESVTLKIQEAVPAAAIMKDPPPLLKRVSATLVEIEVTLTAGEESKVQYTYELKNR